MWRGSDGGGDSRYPRHRRGHQRLGLSLKLPGRLPVHLPLSFGSSQQGWGWTDFKGTAQTSLTLSKVSLVLATRVDPVAKDPLHFLAAFLQGPDQLLCHRQKGLSLEGRESQGLSEGPWVGWGSGRGQRERLRAAPAGSPQPGLGWGERAGSQGTCPKIQAHGERR